MHIISIIAYIHTHTHACIHVHTHTHTYIYTNAARDVPYCEWI